MDLPKLGSFNIHPSLLPLYRGPTPIQSQILADEEDIGVSVIKMDEKVDHGPIVKAEQLILTERNESNFSFVQLGTKLFEIGTNILIESIERLGAGEFTPKKQNDNLATFTQKFKAPQEIYLERSKSAWLAYLALGRSPGVYFMHNNGQKSIRLKIISASFTGDKFAPLKVVPEGRKEMTYADFMRGHA